VLAALATAAHNAQEARRTLTPDNLFITHLADSACAARGPALGSHNPPARRSQPV
jgi:hypothetical protein